ncbi:MAG: hypothetical protein QM817_35710 [Archangium sp.]
MLRFALAVCVVLASAAFAEPVSIRLPPSENWKELEHDGEQRIFVTTDPDESMRLEVEYVEKAPVYTQELLMEYARKIAKDERGKDFHVTEAATVGLRGATAGVMKATSNAGKIVHWWVPGNEWDLHVKLSRKPEAKWNRDAENEVSNSVSLAKNLRGAGGGMSDSQMLIYAGIAAVVLIGGGLAIAVLRRPKTGAAKAGAPAAKSAPPAPVAKKVPDAFKPTKKG